MVDDRSGPEARALWIVETNQTELRAERLSQLRAGEVMVAASFGAISRGTESLVASRGVPESEWERMRAPFQEGAFSFPVKYGYGTVGRIVAGDAARDGERVFCLYPHQERFIVPGEMAVPVPDEVADERAVLAANMETALNVVWDAGILPGDKVAVIGGGVVGLLSAYIAGAIPAADVTVVDVNPERAAAAAALGVAFAAPGNAPVECDVVIHASASEAGLASAIAAAGFEARIVEASWYGDAAPRIPLGGAFHSRRLTIVGSQVGRVPAARAGRWTNRRRLETALRLLADPRLDALFSGETPFAELAAHYPDILADPATLCHRVRYD
ncbi:zinc-dependent alcohol dehydrogenase [Jiella pelagia]|uniref:Zinc-binding alcohol dehydrogenase n=1 Tax=Jiella pelagia TaxID=2986949 RepID=A0ABY7BV83_9HYPH|nr:zinc-binding alcohol dehydrogenase [Jiella pelagia]WAP67389.1 zinc-binding alcohol dehydrogenase [Jiella pelagia]